MSTLLAFVSRMLVAILITSSEGNDGDMGGAVGNRWGFC